MSVSPSDIAHDAPNGSGGSGGLRARLQRIGLLARLDARLWIADRTALVVSFALPIAIVMIMYAAFGGDPSFSATAYVVDNDGGPAAQEVLGTLRSIDGLKVELLSSESAAKRLDRSNLVLAFEIPAGFSDALQRGEPAQIIQRQRGNGGDAGQVVAAIVNAVVANVSAPANVQREAAALLQAANLGDVPVPDATAATVAWQQVNVDPAVAVAVINAEGDAEQADFLQVFYPRIVGWMILFALGAGAQVFVEERRQGTLERLTTTHTTRLELLLGKYAGALLRGMLQLGVLFAVALLVFNIFTLTAFLSGIVFGAICLLALCGVMTLIACLARTPDQASIISTTFTMAMGVAGGTFIIGDVGSVYAAINKVTILWWMNDGFDTLLADGGSLLDVLPSIGIMLVVAVVTLGIASRVFNPQQNGGRP